MIHIQQFGIRGGASDEYSVKHNELTAEEFISLWEIVWGKGIGRLLIDELLKYVNDNGIAESHIFVELCAMPDRIPF